MNRQISFSQYRTIDLTILGVLLAVSQGLIHFASTQWFADQLYVVSPVGAIVALVMMRWGGWAAIHAAAGGVLFAWLAGGTWEHYLVYGGGNLLALAALVMFKIFGKERIRENVVLTLGYAFCVQLLMQLGRAAVSLLLSGSWEASLGFITTDLLSAVFTLFINGIIRRIEGLFEDQKHYLLRVQAEQAEGRGQF